MASEVKYWVVKDGCLVFCNSSGSVAEGNEAANSSCSGSVGGGDDGVTIHTSWLKSADSFSSQF